MKELVGGDSLNIVSNFIKKFTTEDLIDEKFEIEENLYQTIVNYNYDIYYDPSYEDFLQASIDIAKLLGEYSLEFEFKVIDKQTNDTNVESDFFGTIIGKDTESYDKLDESYKNIKSKNFAKIENHEFIRLEMIIKKPMQLANVNRIFFFKEFIDSLNNYNLREMIIDINVGNLKDIIFLISEDIKIFYSSNIYFVHNKEDVEHLKNNSSNYDDLIFNHKLNCHFANSNLTLTPEIFSLVQRSEYSPANLIFDKLCVFVSIIYIANYSEIVNSNILKIRINGYKLIEDEFDFKTTNYCELISFFEIFKWVYNDKKTSDKLELARNIISLDYDDSLYNISDKTLGSIKSNYRIYLKENVEQYIELKNQIISSILDISMKSIDIIETFSTNFKSAFLANLSFFFSVIILNLVGENNIKNVFSRDLSILYLTVIFMSLSYMIFSIFTTMIDIKHYNLKFYNLRSLYKGLLSKEDLDNTFDNSFLKDDKKYVKKRVMWYSILWVLFLIVNLIGLYFLSSWFEMKINVLYKHWIACLK